MILTWNNAPLAYENLAQLVVPPIDCTNGVGRCIGRAHRANGM